MTSDEKLLFMGAGELEVWHADSPLGPWKEHALNPVVNGASHLGARSGGRPLVYEGKLYRFGQDCGETYGHKVRDRGVAWQAHYGGVGGLLWPSSSRGRQVGVF